MRSILSGDIINIIFSISRYFYIAIIFLLCTLRQALCTWLVEVMVPSLWSPPRSWPLTGAGWWAPPSVFPGPMWGWSPVVIAFLLWEVSAARSSWTAWSFFLIFMRNGAAISQWRIQSLLKKWQNETQGHVYRIWIKMKTARRPPPSFHRKALMVFSQTCIFLSYWGFVLRNLKEKKEMYTNYIYISFLSL